MLKVKLLFLPDNLKTDLAAWEKSLMRKIISFNVLQWLHLMGKYRKLTMTTLNRKTKKRFFFLKNGKNGKITFSSKKVGGSPQFTPLTNPERSNLQSQNRN